jgi:hypothetical protein
LSVPLLGKALGVSQVIRAAFQQPSQRPAFWAEAAGAQRLSHGGIGGAPTRRRIRDVSHQCARWIGRADQLPAVAIGASVDFGDRYGLRGPPLRSDRMSNPLSGLLLTSCLLAAFQVEADLLPFTQTSETGALDGRDMYDTAFEPSLGWMNPYPYWELNHLTVRSDIATFSLRFGDPLCVDRNALGTPRCEKPHRQGTINPR